jgi:hypothetical protein
VSRRLFVAALWLGAGIVACRRTTPPPVRASDSTHGLPPAVLAAAQPLEITAILRSPLRDGVRISVRGRCLRLTASVAFGPPPRTRSDWQLGDAADSSVAIWVSGPRPRGCDTASGSREISILSATLASDTVSMFSGAPRARRFLELSP